MDTSEFDMAYKVVIGFIIFVFVLVVIGFIAAIGLTIASACCNYRPTWYSNRPYYGGLLITFALIAFRLRKVF